MVNGIIIGMGTGHAEMNRRKFPLANDDGSQLKSSREEKTDEKSEKTGILENVDQVCYAKSCQKG